MNRLFITYHDVAKSYCFIVPWSPNLILMKGNREMCHQKERFRKKGLRKESNYVKRKGMREERRGKTGKRNLWVYFLKRERCSEKKCRKCSCSTIPYIIKQNQPLEKRERCGGREGRQLEEGRCSEQAHQSKTEEPAKFWDWGRGSQHSEERGMCSTSSIMPPDSLPIAWGTLPFPGPFPVIRAKGWGGGHLSSQISIAATPS